jgi:hypothetical protein
MSLPTSGNKFSSRQSHRAIYECDPFSKNRETEVAVHKVHVMHGLNARSDKSQADRVPMKLTGDDHERMAQALHSRNASWHGGYELPAGRAGLRLGEERLSLESGAVFESCVCE